MDNAHSGIFSDLAVLYSKYSPEKLREHIKVSGRSMKDEGRRTLTLNVTATYLHIFDVKAHYFIQCTASHLIMTI